MNDQEILIELFKYFAKFIRKDVLKSMFVKNNDSPPGYQEIVAEILAAPDDYVIDDIDTYIFSANEGFLSKKIKNSQKTVLYVEYGAFSYRPNVAMGIREKLALHVAYPYNSRNNDNLSETMVMSRTQVILCSILDQMETDQNDLEFCGNRKLIDFPAEIIGIDPPLFYDRTGWMGIFDNASTNMV